MKNNLNNDHSYIICSTPRSGSTLLCDLLADTNIAGCPDSFFMNEHYSSWTSLLGVPVDSWRTKSAFDLRYIEAVIKQGAGETGVFGMRVQWESLGDLSARLRELYLTEENDQDLFNMTLGITHYIHLSREDKVAQAVSLLRADQSGLWHVHPDGSERERIKDGLTPTYNTKALSTLVSRLEEFDAAWTAWLSAQNIQPIFVTYEKLSSHPNIVIGEILSRLGLNPTNASKISPKTKKMASYESKMWIKRFRNGQSDCSK